MESGYCPVVSMKGIIPKHSNCKLQKITLWVAFDTHCLCIMMGLTIVSTGSIWTRSTPGISAGMLGYDALGNGDRSGTNRTHAIQASFFDI